MPKRRSPKAPRQERSRRARETILEAAMDILEKFDIRSATTNRIAERSGFSIGSFYQYFPGKEAILGALIEKAWSHHISILEEKVDRMPAMDLRTYCAFLIDEVVAPVAFRYPKLYRVLLSFEGVLFSPEEMQKPRARTARLIAKGLNKVVDWQSSCDEEIALRSLSHFGGVLRMCLLEGHPPAVMREELVSTIFASLESRNEHSKHRDRI